VQRATVLIPVFYAAAVALALRLRPLLPAMALLYFLVFAFCEGAKSYFYLVHVTPWFACCLAIVAHDFWTRGGLRRWTAAAAFAFCLMLQLGWSAYSIWRNPYRRVYAPVIAYLNEHARGKRITGPGELGFDLGFYGNLKDDSSLGYHSGKQADYIVVDERGYQQFFDGYRTNAPELYRHVKRVLAEDYDRVYDGPIYQIYARRPSRAEARQ
jgi:hypothetical protein